MPWQRFQTEGRARVCSNSNLIVKEEVDGKKEKKTKKKDMLPNTSV